MKKNAISPSRAENYPEWYQQVIKAADLAENAPVRGCMVIKPWGYGVWELIQKILDKKFKETGHQNAYFPLFIPLSYLEKEAQHVEGFAKECAVVTHHRLKKNEQGKLVPEGELEEPLVVRPTSEMIIGEMFAKWISSYRDLPLLINQWANVVRWEMRPRIFLRTTEFLWQEGHTVHASSKEALEEVMKILNLYTQFAENDLALPVIPGEKTEGERFPGAVSTFCIETMMQDCKALQAGTSHFLGQNFSKSCQIQFRDETGELQYGWTTSWGVTTRLIGAVIMTHSDDDGLILPPNIAPIQIVLIPVIHKEETKEEILAFCSKLKKELELIPHGKETLRVLSDERDLRGGEKKWHWIKKGVPLRLEIGLREISSNLFGLERRDSSGSDISKFSREELVNPKTLPTVLDEIQKNLLDKARKFREDHTVKIDQKEAFYEFFTPKNKDKPEIHGGFALCHWAGDSQLEKQIKEDLNVTIRCIPLHGEKEKGICPFSGKPSHQRVIFAKAY